MVYVIYLIVRAYVNGRKRGTPNFAVRSVQITEVAVEEIGGSQSHYLIPRPHWP